MLSKAEKNELTLNGSYDWAFVAVLVLICASLTMLQYKWMQQIGKAETDQLRARFGEGLQSLCVAFDLALFRAYQDLTPDWSEIQEAGHEQAHARLFKTWKAKKPGAIFKRIAYVVPEPTGLQLRILNQENGASARSDWPAEWKDLEANLTAKARRGAANSATYLDPRGAIQEFPVFARRNLENDRVRGTGGANPDHEGPPSGEKEWALYELDLQYLQSVWLPRLLRKHLGTDGLRTLGYAEIVTKKSLFPISEWGPRKNAGNEMPVRVEFHRNQRGLVGFAPRRGEPAPAWVLQAWQSPSRLADLVSVTRRNNLAVALLLNGLLVVTGLTLIKYTRQSRLLAETQMRFVANVSHELRTPLTVIRGASHNLLNGVLAEGNQQRIQDYVGRIRQHAEALSAMVEQILDLGRAKRTFVAKSFRGVDVGDVVRQAVAVTQEETKGCVLDVQLAPNLLSVKGDSTALQRAFQNLIVNAAKHGANGGWIGITGVIDEEKDPMMVEVQVADRGDGIALDELNKIFTPFYRGLAAEAAQVRGSGLGLSLVKEIVEGHGGAVAVESELGQGTRFTVRLPLAKGEEGA